MFKVITPTKEDQVKINAIIKYFARGYMERGEYMAKITAILAPYRGKKYDLDQYTIKLEKYQGKSYIIVQGKGINDRCPCCLSTVYRYLSTVDEAQKYDRITVSCMDCGAVYDTFGWKGEGE